MIRKLTADEIKNLKRKHARKQGKVVDNINELADIKADIRHGKFTPQETKGLVLGPDAAKELGVKFPARLIADELRRFLKERGLEADYRVLKRQLDPKTYGDNVWGVTVTYSPPDKRFA